MRISDWRSDVCSSDLLGGAGRLLAVAGGQHVGGDRGVAADGAGVAPGDVGLGVADPLDAVVGLHRHRHPVRSEEHTSELQSLMRISYAVFCLKKKKSHTNRNTYCVTYICTIRRTQ